MQNESIIADKFIYCKTFQKFIPKFRKMQKNLINAKKIQ
jgi:hypothetical protein